MQTKVCSNKECKSKGQPLELSNFHKKGAHGLSSRCKNCENEKKRQKRIKDKRKIRVDFQVQSGNVDSISFVSGLRGVIDECNEG
ncbi:hypothetical protein M902_1828 [Bacteriovorax sp. BAL6_X]|uniref:hypothetical protein n=1 Tax=Bacteriovorax sp. BAL6_X TaxID=1201290 RepID=UPI000386CC64|nr:hypothetical protein [Bacteriovorax sp. BAL6_X]EPZ51921.1 hypothetical protein M902_1828 [Bacteriovorax sp. BAL6_X]